MRADLRHIMHAVRFLKPGGKLAALCLNGTQREAQLKPMASQWIHLPVDSFKETGTRVDVVMMLITPQSRPDQTAA
jgi:hypothetical protein